MKIKVTIASVLFFIVSFSLNAQTNRFIEVAAIDTIELKPVEFTYQITVGYSSPFPMNMRTEKDPDHEPEITIAAIKKVLDRSGFAYEVKNQGNYSVSPHKTPDSAIFLHLKSESELTRLYKLLLSVKGISGKISDAKYESVSPVKTDTYQRLYSKALADATTIAKISGNSIGKLISVAEPQQSDFMGEYMSMFKDMAASEMFAEMLQLNKSLIQKIEKRLLFRFELL